MFAKRLLDLLVAAATLTIWFAVYEITIGALFALNAPSGVANAFGVFLLILAAWFLYDTHRQVFRYIKWRLNSDA